MPAPSGAPAERLAPELAELGAAPDADALISSTDSDAAPPLAPRVGRRARAALCAAGAAAACGLLLLRALGAPRGSGPPQHRQDADAEAVSLGALGLLGEMLESGGSVLNDGVEADKALETLPGQIQGIGSELVGDYPDGVTAHGPLVDALKNGTFSAWLQNETNREKLKKLLKKPNNKHDGNFCEDDEEEHASLCYKKCSLITNGAYPFRGTAFSCCRSQPCTLFNSHFIMSMCSGYDIAGDRANNQCPHSRGACYADEELHANMCFKKCLLLTNGTHGFRTAADSCCKYQGVMQCLMHANSSLTNPLYGVGGGEFEKTSLNKSVNSPHPPVVVEAEEP